MHVPRAGARPMYAPRAAHAGMLPMHAPNSAHAVVVHAMSAPHAAARRATPHSPPGHRGARTVPRHGTAMGQVSCSHMWVCVHTAHTCARVQAVGSASSHNRGEGRPEHCPKVHEDARDFCIAARCRRRHRRRGRLVRHTSWPVGQLVVGMWQEVRWVRCNTPAPDAAGAIADCPAVGRKAKGRATARRQSCVPVGALALGQRRQRVRSGPYTCVNASLRTPMRGGGVRHPLEPSSIGRVLYSGAAPHTRCTGGQSCSKAAPERYRSSAAARDVNFPGLHGLTRAAGEASARVRRVAHAGPAPDPPAVDGAGASSRVPAVTFVGRQRRQGHEAGRRQFQHGDTRKQVRVAVLALDDMHRMRRRVAQARGRRREASRRGLAGAGRQLRRQLLGRAAR
eukprot:366273-Chlamydomonas_euryale.AAC.9